MEPEGSLPCSQGPSTGPYPETSSRGQPTRGGPPAWGLGVGLTTPHRKKISLLRDVNVHRFNLLEKIMYFISLCSLCFPFHTFIIFPPFPSFLCVCHIGIPAFSLPLLYIKTICSHGSSWMNNQACYLKMRRELVLHSRLMKTVGEILRHKFLPSACF
jgi:hypothetical protein